MDAALADQFRKKPSPRLIEKLLAVHLRHLCAEDSPKKTPIIAKRIGGQEA
jgi:hypothetical protein